MPNWKKLITSGSDASLNSISVTTNVQAVSFTGSLFGTASYALNFGNVSGYYFTQSVPTTSWVITHNLNTQTPLVQVYDINHKVIIPNEITNTSLTTTQIDFTYNQDGYAVISRGEGLSELSAVTSSYALTAATASYFSGSVANAISSSYALTASYFITSSVSTASYVELAQTASYVLNAVSSSYALSASYAPIFPYTGSGIISGSLSITGSTNISGSLTIAGLKDFADDTAAAAGGIPINGIYRNGNFLLIRLS